MKNKKCQEWHGKQVLIGAIYRTAAFLLDSTPHVCVRAVPFVVVVAFRYNLRGSVQGVKVL